jgi:pimeloyl-ACP methyl ester carboxylesterase
MGNRTRSLLKRLSMFLFYLFAAYIVLLIVLRFFENRMIFFPNYPSRLEGDWHPRALAPEDVWFTASDGTKLHAWWIFNPDAKFTFLAFHGNASNIANREATYEFLRDAPGNVLALEYRGYGHSEGKPSEAGLYLDADAAYQFLINTKRVDPQSILSFGQSLGTTVAADLAAHRQVGGLILEAPLPSASRAASKLFWLADRKGEDGNPQPSRPARPSSIPTQRKRGATDRPDLRSNGASPRPYRDRRTGRQSPSVVMREVWTEDDFTRMANGALVFTSF